MTTVADQPVVVPRLGYVSDADQHSYETEDAVTKYLEQWLEIDGRKSVLFNDRCTLGLLAAVRTAKSSAASMSSSGPTTASTECSR